MAMYTSRQLLDPQFITSYYDKQSQVRQKAWDDLAKIGEAIGDKVQEQNRKEYLLKEKGVEKLEDLPEWADPQFRAAAYSYMKGDRSGIDNYYNTQVMRAAADAEAQKKAKEEKITKQKLYQYAKDDIATYNTEPEKKIKAIQTAIKAGDEAGEDTTDLRDMLKKEQNDLEESYLAGRAYEIETEKAKIEAADYEAEKNEVKDKLKDRLKKLPKNAAAKNAEIEEISKIAYMYGLTGLDIPEFAIIKKSLTPKEQDEYNDLLDKKNDGRLVKQEDIRRFNWLSQYVK